MNTLVSFNVCPFVQRSLIVLEEKGVRDRYEIRYIDLDNKPDWFLRYSPTGKVPILVVNDAVLFESAAINEYLDDTSPGERLQPADPLRRAHNRAWIAFISEALVMRNQMQHAPTEREAREHANRIHRALFQLERQLGKGPFFNGDLFSLVDAAAAPLFQRLHWLTDIVPDLGVLDGLPGLQDWGNKLVHHPSVIRSAGDGLRSRYLAYLQEPRQGGNTGWLGRMACTCAPTRRATVPGSDSDE
jgi:glutathione S-transferase